MSLFRKIFRISFFLLVLFLFSGTLFLLGKAVFFSSKISIEKNKNPLENAKKITLETVRNKPHELKETNNRINILLLGRAGTAYPGRNLTDTVMLFSVDTKRKEAGFLSLPRDLYAPIPETGLYTKINSLYQYGLSTNTNNPFEPIAKSVSTITGEPIHYVFSLDFDGFEKAIDAIGGVSVYNDRHLYDTRYPGKNYSYETFELPEGWHTLDGKTVLKYVRERHGDPRGDFGRAKRQQDVLLALREKIFSPTLFANVFALGNLIDALGESVQTDIAPEEYESFIELAKTIGTKNLSTVVVDAWKKESLLRVSHISTKTGSAFILVPRTGNWNEVRDTTKHLFDANELLARKEKILEENANILVIGTKETKEEASRFSKFLTGELGMPSVQFLFLDILSPVENANVAIDTTNLKKPYSLDELLKKFPFEKREAIPFNTSLLPKKSAPDILLIPGKSFRSPREYDTLTENAFSEEAANEEALIDPLPFSEISN